MKKRVTHILFIFLTVIGVFFAPQHAQKSEAFFGLSEYYEGLKDVVNSYRLLRESNEFAEAPAPALPLRENFQDGPDGQREFEQARVFYSDTLAQLQAIARGNSAEAEKLTKKIETDKKALEAMGCSFVNISACFQSLLQLIGNLVLSFWAIFLWLAGMILNLVLDVTLVNMSGSMGYITGINSAWIAIRDVANMLFIFALLYIAISTILGLAGGATKKVLAHVIIAALLINFSLFFTKVIIDASNILALGFYKNIPGVGNFANSATGAPGTTVDKVRVNGLSGSIMGSLKLQSIYDTAKNLSSNSNNGGVASQNLLSVAFAPVNFAFATGGGSVFILITAVVFLMTAVLFVIRFVILILLMILSPLAFVGMILPQMSKHSKEWWDTLFGQALFAPALMMMIWVTLKIAGGLKSIPQLKDGDNFFDVLTAQAGASFGIVLNFFIIIIMLIASIIIANKISKTGSAGIMEYANRLQGFIGRRAVRGFGDYGIRRIDEVFGESALGKTPIGHAVREYTTGYLTNAKFGGTISAEESYQEDKKFKAEREDLQVKDDVVALVGQFKNASTEYEKAKEDGDKDSMKIKAGEKDRYVQLMQRKLSRINAHDFAEIIPKNLYNDVDFMRNATTGQVQAVMDGDRLETDEKEHMIQARNKHVTSAFDVLEERRMKYLEMEKAFADSKTEIEGTRILGEIEKEFPKGAPDMSSEFPEIHKEMRAANLKDVELLYWANPEAFMKRGLSSFRYTIVQGLRDSNMVGKADSDNIRDLKPFDFVDSSDNLKGINALLINVRNAKGEIDHQLENVNESLRDGMRKIYKDAYQTGEDLEKLFDKEHEVKDMKGGVHKLKFDKKLIKEFGEKNMTAALSGKTYEEMRKFRNWLRNDPNIGRYLSRSHAVYIGRQDKDDVEQVVNHLLIERWRENTDKAKKYKMSEQNKAFLDWIESDAKEAQSFMEGNYKYELKDSSGKLIDTLKINRKAGGRMAPSGLKMKP